MRVLIPLLFALLSLVLLRPTTVRAAPSSPAPLPIRYFTDNIQGVYDGTVMDGGQPVPQMLTLRRSPSGAIHGIYTVRQGRTEYEGTFSNAVVAGPFTLRFTWQDHHGQGVVIVTFTPDGARFDGNWGEHQVRPDLTIDGKRRQ